MKEERDIYVFIVFLVDDDVEFIEVVCIIIEFFGYEVFIVVIFKEVCDWLEKEIFDYVLFDFMLFDGSGVYLFNELDVFFKCFCVILIMGYFFVKSVIKGLCGFMVDYFVKLI